MRNGIILRVFLSLMVLVLLGSCITSYQKQEFDALEWKENVETRYKMEKDILKNKILLGKTKEEAIELFGEFDLVFDNDYSRYYLGFNFNSKNIFYAYKIIFFGENVLDIYFNDNKVIKVIGRNRNYYVEKKFNKNDWENYIESRFIMSKNIITSKMLISKTKEEVFEILGNIECTVNEDRIKYYLGFVPGPFNIDPSILTIFLENGKVTKVMIYEA